MNSYDKKLLVILNIVVLVIIAFSLRSGNNPAPTTTAPVYNLIFLVAGFFGAYLVAFFKKSGELDATQRQLNKILDQISQQTRATESIKNEIKKNSWLEQERWKLRKDIYFELFEKCHEKSYSLYSLIKKHKLLIVHYDNIVQHVESGLTVPEKSINEFKNLDNSYDEWELDYDATSNMLLAFLRAQTIVPETIVEQFKKFEQDLTRDDLNVDVESGNQIFIDDKNNVSITPVSRDYKKLHESIINHHNNALKILHNLIRELTKLVKEDLLILDISTEAKSKAS